METYHLIMILGGVLGILGYIRLIIAGARVHLVWVAAIPLIPFAALLFVIKYWQRAKGPVLMYIAGVLIACLGLALAPVAPRKIVHCQHSDCQVMMPADWSSRNDLVDGADLQVGNTDDMYLVVESVDRQNLGGTSPEQYADLWVRSFSKLAQIKSVVGPKRVQLGNHSALQYTIETQFEGVDTTVIYTAVAQPNRFYNVYSWIPTSDFAKREQTLHTMIDSFTLNPDRGSS